MFFVYVLQSEATGKNCIGFFRDVIQRLGQHNSGITESTKNRGPWKVVYQELFSTRSAAMKRERFLKSGQSREELKRLAKARLIEVGIANEKTPHSRHS
jgi:putative endonuclease